ncbi:uncharacterized protein LOC122871757 [Siniperca chuatsi]|uniref:uncharacterized protein LOC122871757 n=1 Tax=Siniperca chuatsi TaxID=119488 RepID=UPI001CE03422|nr:uncharacterized protein LOC122871757 [Siniperca chuatsi]
MAKPGALLLLLAVAASQVDLLSAVFIVNSGEMDISSCPITFYGRNYSMVDVSFKDSSAVICFKEPATETPTDCVLIKDQLTVDRMNVNIFALKISPGSPLHLAVPNIKTTSDCVIHFYLQDGNFRQYINVIFYSFGAQTVMASMTSDAYTSATYSLNATVGSSSMGSWSFPKSSDWKYVDVSGCRISDAPFVVNSSYKKLNPEKCSMQVCDASASTTPVSTCGALEVCLGNNKCVQPIPVCTVTGSTVIDFSGRVYSVPDRCVYGLMKPQKSSNFTLLAGFMERRRQDVPFLDHLILWLEDTGVNMYLEQGGRVRVKDQILTLSTTAQLVHGVELSKDQTGVTAKILSLNATVFFDGNTAHVAGPAGAVKGLCGSPTQASQTTTLSAEKSSSYSALGCERQPNDTVDSTIVCSLATEHCNLMRQAPFTACHSLTDPEPYITACTNTLCKYPEVDDLKCQFLEAYAKSCNLKGSIGLEDWRSKAGCSAVPQAFCQDQYCSPHEFCGEKLGGTRCYCRAIFASKYKPTNTLGEPTVCMKNSATLALAGCLLEDNGIDYSALQLNDQKCKGYMDQQTHMVTFSFDGSNTCGTEVTTNDSQIIYKNAIKMSTSSGIITRNDQVYIDFSCFYTKPDVKSVAFKIKDGSVVQQVVSGVWNYTLMMNAYTNAGRTDLVRPDTEIGLNQKIWVELKTEGLDGNMVALVTDSCWATNQRSPTDTLRYNLVINGCPNPEDQTVKVEGNGLGTSNSFSFNMFQFSGKSGEIYLHCKLDLCATQGHSCAQSCGTGAVRRRRSSRSKYADESPALITMAWSN